MLQPQLFVPAASFSRTKIAFAVATLLALSGSFYGNANAATDNAQTDNVPNTKGEQSSNPTAPDTENRIVITAPERLKNARTEMLPNIGTTVYSIDKNMINKLGQGDSTPFDEVLLRLPGVVQDSKASGSLHIRDEHGNVQYRVNGVELPEGIAGFGQSIDSRFIENMDFVTGALPAQYGLRTAGIIDIQTKEGTLKPGGRVGVLLGSHNYVEPSAEVFGGSDGFSYYRGAIFKITSALKIQLRLKIRFMTKLIKINRLVI